MRATSMTPKNRSATSCDDLPNRRSARVLRRGQSDGVLRIIATTRFQRRSP